MKVRILGQTYTIEYADPDIMVSGGGSLGYCVHDQNKIYIVTGLPPDREREVRLHEITHALWNETGLTVGDVDEERVANAMGRGLAAILADNDSATIRQLFR